MLFELGIENFKPFGDRQVAPLSKITLIYGPNSAGKSSLIQALMLLRQTFEAGGQRSTGLIPRGEYVDLGSFRSLIHRHDVNRALSISLGYDRMRGTRPFVLGLPGDETRRTTLSFRAQGTRRPRRDSSELAAVRYELDEGRVLNSAVSRAPEQLDLPDALEGSASRAHFQWEDDASRVSYAKYLIDYEARRRKMRHRTDSRNLKGNSRDAVDSEPELLDLKRTTTSLRDTLLTGWGLLPDKIVPANRDEPSEEFSVRFRQSQPLERLATELNSLLLSMVYLGPVRSHPARHYLVTGGPSDFVGVRGESMPQVIYRASKEFSSEINNWLKRFEIPYRMQVKQIGDELTGEIIALHLTDSRSKRLQVGPSDVGFGIGQLLPIIVQGLVPRRGIICVEQPEIHLHPKLQAHIADFLIETSEVASTYGGRERGRATQWIVETHSEALMLRLQRRVREKRLSPEDVSVLYVEPISSGGSRVARLRLDEEGEFIDEWPQGFFEEGFRELFPEAQP